MAIAGVNGRRLIWPIVLALVAVVLYDTSIKRRNMVDFGVYRVAAGRALAAEPLYREDDGHYKFKYLPAFAFAMAPFAWLEASTAKALWFGLSVGLLAALLRWSICAIPRRRRSSTLLIVLTVVVMAKFYGHELTLGQSNILLGTVLVAALVAVEAGVPLARGGALRPRGVREAVCGDPAAVGAGVVRLRRDAGERGGRRGGTAASGARLRLAGQHRSADGVVGDSDGIDGVHAGRRRQRVGGRDVGQVAGRRHDGDRCWRHSQVSCCSASLRSSGCDGGPSRRRSISRSRC